MSLQITFLGTAASIPTATRSLPSVAVYRKGELLLFDCGEGTQRQMINGRIGLNRRTKIMVTHMHGDHILGAPGLFQTMSLLGRNRPIKIYGPVGIGDFIQAVIQTVRFSLGFQIEIQEIREPGKIEEEKEYSIYASWADHSVPCLGYSLIEKDRPGRFHPERAISLDIPEGPLWSRLQNGEEIRLSNGKIAKPRDVLGPPRPGRKIVYVGDTRPSDSIVDLAFGADVLIHEATFGDDMSERAKEDHHSTPSEAAVIAEKAKVGLLVLTHISARYGDTNEILNQARQIFPRVRVAEDLMKIEIPLREV